MFNVLVFLNNVNTVTNLLFPDVYNSFRITLLLKIKPLEIITLSPIPKFFSDFFIFFLEYSTCFS